MRVAQLNEDNVYVGTIELDDSDRNPLENGNFIIPGGCITTLPSWMPKKHFALWDGEKYEIIPMQDPPEEHLELAEKIKSVDEYSIREERNARLAATDWTQLADVPNEIKNKWVEYRQKLRDIPQQEGFPTEFDWPTDPDMEDKYPWIR